jgi:hypothetical protein
MVKRLRLSVILFPAIFLAALWVYANSPLALTRDSHWVMVGWAALLSAGVAHTITLYVTALLGRKDSNQ